MADSFPLKCSAYRFGDLGPERYSGNPSLPKAEGKWKSCEGAYRRNASQRWEKRVARNWAENWRRVLQRLCHVLCACLYHRLFGLLPRYSLGCPDDWLCYDACYHPDC